MRRVLIVAGLILITLAILASPSYAQDGRDITRFGSDFVVREGETITGDVTVFGGDATIEGTVEGNVTVFGGDLRVNGRVGENVTTFGGNITLGSEAVVEGDLTHFGGTVTRAPGAVVMGNETTGIRFFSPFANLFAALLSLIATLVLAALVVAILPEQTRVLANTVENEALRSAGVGILATVLIPVVFIILALIIIVGWLLIPIVAVAIPIVYFYGYVGVARWLGRRVIDATRVVSDTPIAQVLIGALIFGIIGFVPILGGLIIIAAAIVGLGAVILSKFGTGRPWFRRSEAEQAPPPGGEGAA